MPKFDVTLSRMIQQTITLSVEIPVDDSLYVAENEAREQLAQREHDEFVEWETPQQEMTYECESVQRTDLEFLDEELAPEMDSYMRQPLIDAYYEVVISYLSQTIETDACNKITDAMKAVMTKEEVREANRLITNSAAYKVASGQA